MHKLIRRCPVKQTPLSTTQIGCANWHIDQGVGQLTWKAHDITGTRTVLTSQVKWRENIDPAGAGFLVSVPVFVA